MFSFKPGSVLLIVCMLFSVVACGSGGGGSSSAVTPPAPAANNEPDPVVSRVIVVGAGIAGLRAAERMSSEGLEVTVLESRDRVGGRLWSDRSAEGLALDLGASWIHGIGGNPLYDFVTQNGIETSEWDYDNYLEYDTEGNLTQNAESADVLTAGIANNIDESEPQESIQQVIDRALSIGDITGFSQQQLDFLVSLNITAEFATDPDRLSSGALIEGNESFDDPEVVFPGGYDQLATTLAASLDIRLETPVSNIDYQNDVVVVSAGSETFEADAVLVTVPLGVLKNDIITFNPALPEIKQAAIRDLEMGVLNKVYLLFPEVFWDAEATNFGYVSDTANEFPYWINLAPLTGQPVLGALNTGSFAISLESLSDEEIVEYALNVLTNVIGATPPTPSQYWITRWNQDPHSYGSYSALVTTATASQRADLAEPVENRVFFAGEATSQTYPATVHGAFLSGEREAQRILDLNN